MIDKTGGPAFPTIEVTRDGETRFETTYWGMSLRDYFAGQEMCTYRATPWGPLGKLWGRLWYGPSVSDAEVAKESYAMADAMLVERDEGNAP